MQAVAAAKAKARRKEILENDKKLNPEKYQKRVKEAVHEAA